MRKSQLRQYADRILSEDNRGSRHDKLFRHFVIHKVIDGLFAIGDVPIKWHALNQMQITKLIAYWQRKKTKPATIMKYMTVIRKFLHTIDHNIPDISNQNLGLYRKINSTYSGNFSLDYLEKISDPIAKLLLQFQIHFGLTLSEAMRLLPDVHAQENAIWLTREVASNSQDRVIPLRSELQKEILQEFTAITRNESSIIESYGYDAVRHAYRINLTRLKLPSRKSWRFLYAQQLYKELSPLLRNYELCLLIMREMGLESRVTLWGYLRE